MVQATKELNSMLTNTQVSEGDVLFQSDQYIQLGCDLRDLGTLRRVLSDVIDVDNCKSNQIYHHDRVITGFGDPQARRRFNNLLP